MKPTKRRKPGQKDPGALINISAFRAAADTGQPVTISSEQLRQLLDAYEAQMVEPKQGTAAVVGEVARITLQVVVPRKNVGRLRRHRGPLFVYGAYEISDATDLPLDVIREAIREGIIRPGELHDVLSLQTRIRRLQKPG